MFISKLRPDTPVDIFTSTIQLEAFYSCRTQQLLESLVRTGARDEPPYGALTTIGAGMSLIQDAFESAFEPQDLSRSAGLHVWELGNGEE